MVTVHVEGSAKEVREELLALFATSANAPPAPASAGEQKPAKAAKKEAVEPEQKDAAQTAAASKEKELKVEDVSAKVAELLKKHPRPKVVELIASFGAKKGSEIAPEKWVDFMKKADELK